MNANTREFKVTEDNIEKWKSILSEKEQVDFFKRLAKFSIGKQNKKSEFFIRNYALFSSLGSGALAFVLMMYVLSGFDGNMLFSSPTAFAIFLFGVGAISKAKSEEIEEKLSTDEEIQFLWNFTELDDGMRNHIMDEKFLEKKNQSYKEYVKKYLHKDKKMLRLDYEILQVLEKRKSEEGTSTISISQNMENLHCLEKNI